MRPTFFGRARGRRPPGLRQAVDGTRASAGIQGAQAHLRRARAPSWLRPVPKTERRIDGGPPVAKSSAETEAQRQRVHSLFEAGGTTAAPPTMTGFRRALTGPSARP